ncbi:MAG: hypothetical protein V7739_19460 [Motiliproteus sp.]
MDMYESSGMLIVSASELIGMGVVVGTLFIVLGWLLGKQQINEQLVVLTVRLKGANARISSIEKSLLAERGAYDELRKKTQSIESDNNMKVSF